MGGGDKAVIEKILKKKEIEMGTTLNTAAFLNREMHINYGHKFLYDYNAIVNFARDAG